MNTPVTPTQYRQLPDPAVAREWLAAMLLVRRFDQRAAELRDSGRAGGFLHTSVGEEAVIVGVTRAIEDRDWLLSTYRSHALALARGSDPSALIAELLGRQTGLMRGLGGALHVTDLQRRVLGGFGLVAEHLPIAAGVALGSTQEGRAEVAVSVLGAAGTANGTFGEAVELAVAWRLPLVVVAVRETGGADVSDQTQALARKVEGIGIKTLACDGMDVVDVHAAVTGGLRIARTERRPVLVEAVVHRAPTASPASAKPAGDGDVIDAWKRRDPLASFGDRLVEVGVLDHSDRTRVQMQAGSIIEQATTVAARGPAAKPGDAEWALWRSGTDGSDSWWTWPVPVADTDEARSGRR